MKIGDGEVLSLGQLMRIFMLYPIEAIPIIDERRLLTGVLTRNNLSRLSSRRADLKLNAKEVMEKAIINIDDSFSVNRLLDVVSGNRKGTKFPVMDTSGKIIAIWDKTHLIHSFKGNPQVTAHSYEVILDILPFGVIVSNMHGVIVYSNTSANLLVKMNKTEIIGNRIEGIFGDSLAKVNEGKNLNGVIQRGSATLVYDVIPVMSTQQVIGNVMTVRCAEEWEKHEKQESKLRVNVESEGLSSAMKSVEKQLIEKCLKEMDGDTAKASKSLKISRQTLQYKIKKLGIRI